eukprot:maker-scaffold_24-snap-gene-3.36-mRNA-1 protein AED:0.00 eAED:0.00 QI:43/1/0.5/1/0/0/2/305/289
MEEFITHQIGNVPILLTAPHDGILAPEHIRPRKTGHKLRDMHSSLVLHAVNILLQEKNKIPYFVKFNLHRSRCDANRKLEEAVEELEISSSEFSASQIYSVYHNKIMEYLKEISEKFGFVFLLDFHGQVHRSGIELGYLLNISDLEKLSSDISLEEIKNILLRSSLNNLLKLNSESCENLRDLIIGNESFGYKLKQKIFCVPNDKEKTPCVCTEEICECKYFSGGFTIEKYTKLNEFKVFGIQLEIGKNIRYISNSKRKFQPNEVQIKLAAEGIVNAIEYFLQLHLSNY